MIYVTVIPGVAAADACTDRIRFDATNNTSDCCEGVHVSFFLLWQISFDSHCWINEVILLYFLALHLALKKYCPLPETHQLSWATVHHLDPNDDMYMYVHECMHVCSLKLLKIHTIWDSYPSSQTHWYFQHLSCCQQQNRIHFNSSTIEDLLLHKLHVAAIFKVRHSFDIFLMWLAWKRILWLLGFICIIYANSSCNYSKEFFSLLLCRNCRSWQ